MKFRDITSTVGLVNSTTKEAALLQDAWGIGEVFICSNGDVFSDREKAENHQLMLDTRENVTTALQKAGVTNAWDTWNKLKAKAELREQLIEALKSMDNL